MDNLIPSPPVSRWLGRMGAGRQTYFLISNRLNFSRKWPSAFTDRSPNTKKPPSGRICYVMLGKGTRGKGEGGRGKGEEEGEGGKGKRRDQGTQTTIVNVF